MDTSQYDAETRKEIKRGQRTLAYRELHKRATEARAALEQKLRERNAAIERLVKYLTEKGFDEAAIRSDVVKLAA
jgi:hypothetical protein